MYEADKSGTCPHCHREVVFKYGGVANLLLSPIKRESLQLKLYENEYGDRVHLFDDRLYKAGGKLIDVVYIDAVRCPASDCRKLSIAVTPLDYGLDYSSSLDPVAYSQIEEQELVWPRHPSVSISPHVPEHVARDYREAHAVLSISPNASAALARRCLQTILREEAGVKERSLYEEIKKAAPTLPGYINQNYLKLLKEAGNMAAHLERDTAGEVIDVESAEAQWCLNLVEDLFDHYYIKPAVTAQNAAKIQSKIDAKEEARQAERAAKKAGKDTD